MDILTDKKFRAVTWLDNSRIVEGTLQMADFKTCDPADFETNKNGYSIVIVEKSGARHMIAPDTLEIINDETDVKAKKWDELLDEISKCYFDEEGNELSEEESEDIDLGTIGEIAAQKLGFL